MEVAACGEELRLWLRRLALMQRELGDGEGGRETRTCCMRSWINRVGRKQLDMRGLITALRGCADWA